MKTARPHSTSAACRQAQDVLLLDAAPTDATTRIRVDRHVGHCAACQAIRAGLASTRATVQAAAPPLDDVRRARMLARLAPAIDELAARAAGARARRLGWIPGTPPRWPLVSLAALAAAACLVLAIGARHHRPPVVVAVPASIAGAAAVPATPSVARSAVVPPAVVPPAEAPALIQPYRIVSARRGSSQAAALWLNQRFARLHTPAGTKLRAHVGPRTRVTLIGATDVAVQAATPEVLDLTLDEGTLVADFDHRNGTRLRIHSPGAITEVTGTLFSIEVRGGESRVSVAHGRVLVQPATGAARVVSAGQSWQSGTPAAASIPAATAALLADHDAATRSAIGKPLDEAARAAAPAAVVARRTLAGALALSATPAAPAAAAPPLTPAPPATTAPPARKTAPMTLALTAPAAPPTPDAPSPARSEAPTTTPATDAVVYADAERAMRRRDWTAARHALEQVVAMDAPGALPDVARYELAQLALRTADDARAGRWLDALLASDREPALREPARMLRCELRARAGDTALARRCLETFRAGAPRAGRDALALGWLLRLTAARAPCTTVRALADEYLQRYPDGPDAALATQRKTQCLP